MASEFTVLSSKYYDQIINDEDFSLSPMSFNEQIRGNVGDVIKLVQEVEVSVSFNLDENITISFDERAWDAVNAGFTAGLTDWYDQGFYPGASVEVSQGVNTENITVTGITNSNTQILISAADGVLLTAFLTYGSAPINIVFKLLSPPTYISYKYGLNPVGFVGENYQSPLDSNEQAYYSNTIPTLPAPPADMIFVGGEIGASLGAVTVAFLATSPVDTYRHQFQIEHTFKNPYYVSGQLTNLETPVNPDNLIGTNTFRYDNRFEIGTPTYHNSVFVNNGTIGNVGYFDENYNGLVNDYSIENLVITNPSATGKLEATETNTITFDVVSSVAFNAGLAGIIGHSKLPTPAEYQNKSTPYDIIWIFDNLRNVETGIPITDGLYTNFSFNIDGGDPNRLNVSVTIDYTLSQQFQITSTSNYLLWFTIANQDLTDSELIDRVNLIVEVNSFSENLDVSELLSQTDMRFFPEYRNYTGTGFTNIGTGDGDLKGGSFTTKLDTTRETRIVGANFRIIASDGTTEFGIGQNTYFPMFPIVDFDDGTYTYQILNFDIENNLNLPSDAPLNRLIVDIDRPLSSQPLQDASFRWGFQIPWRDWVENLDVDLDFYDAAELNNNLNDKTSNYSGLLGYVIYGVLDLEISNSEITEANTTYRIRSSPSTVLDFDVAGWTGFTGNTIIETLDGDPLTDFENGQDLIIKVECTHALGTIALIDLAAFMWIEINGSTLRPYFLSDTNDFSSEDNWLQASDTLMTGNTQFVEIVSTLNLVTLICKSNSDNIEGSGIDVKPKGRLWHKT